MKKVLMLNLWKHQRVGGLFRWPRCFLFLLLAGSCLADEKQLVVAGNYEPKAVIIVGQKATETEQFAARELQIYIARSSSAFLPVAVEKSGSNDVTEIVVGTPASFSPAFGLPKDVLPEKGPLSDQAYRIKTVGQRVYLIGNSPRSALWACYTFLEKAVGIRWIKPGNDGEVIPPCWEISFPEFDKTYRPSFAIRGYHPCAGWYPKTDIYLWMARNRMNLVTTWGPKPELCKLLGLDTKTGGHVFEYGVPPTLFQEHPEYFSLINGKRDSQAQQRCYSNPGIGDLMVGYIKQTLYDNDYYSIIATDTDQGWCQCPACQALDKGNQGYSGRIWGCLNGMASKLETTFPGRRFIGCAYWDYTVAPKTIKPDSRFYIDYCDYQRCCMHPYQSTHCPHTASFMGRAKEWISFGSPVMVYAYYADMQNFIEVPFSTFVPFAFFVAADIKFYRSIGMQGMMPEIVGESYSGRGADYWKKCSGHWFNNKATYYLIAKLLWDSDLNYTEVLDDMYRSYYGPAAQPLRKAYALIEETYSIHTCGKPGRLLSPEQVTALKTLFDEARKSIPEYETGLRSRVEREIAMYDYWVENVRYSPNSKVQVPVTENLPETSAQLSDPAWQGVPLQSLLAFPKGVPEKEKYKFTRTEAKFQLQHDDQNLYLRVILPKSAAGKEIPVLDRDNPAILTRNPVEIYLIPSTNPNSMYYHFAVSVSNSLYDGWTRSEWEPSATWNGNIKTASNKEGKDWVVDFAIPAGTVQGKINSEEKWLLFVYCKDGPLGWPNPIQGIEEEFGTISFSE